MLRELIEYRKSIREEMKATLREIKKNPQGNNSKGMEARVQIKNLEDKEEINIQSEQNEKTRILKNEERLRNLWDNFKHSNIQIIGVPEKKRKSKKLEAYLKK